MLIILVIIFLSVIGFDMDDNKDLVINSNMPYRNSNFKEYINRIKIGEI